MTASRGPRLFTVGHGTRSTDELVAVLRAAGSSGWSTCGASPAPDATPTSAARPSRPTSLSPTSGGATSSAGAASGPPPAAISPWRVEAFQAYADYMDTAEFRTALLRLVDSAGTTTTAVMCAETLWSLVSGSTRLAARCTSLGTPWKCHRRLSPLRHGAGGVDVPLPLSGTT